MTTLIAPRSRNAVHPLPLAAGLFAIGLAVYHVATPGPPAASYDTVADWLREGLFLGLLLGSVAAVWAAHADGLAPRATVWLLTVAYGLITIGVSVGIALQDDPAWFMFVGGPGILLSTAGYVTWAVWGVRRRVLPAWAAALCGVGGALVIVAAEFGTSVLLAGFWLYLAFRSSQTRS